MEGNQGLTDGAWLSSPCISLLPFEVLTMHINYQSKTSENKLSDYLLSTPNPICLPRGNLSDSLAFILPGPFACTWMKHFGLFLFVFILHKWTHIILKLSPPHLLCLLCLGTLLLMQQIKLFKVLFKIILRI